jgi:Ca-activated chloride channel family protein
VSFDRPAWLVIGILAIAAFALAYRALARRRTRIDLAYSNVQFFLAAAQPRRWIPIAFEAAWIIALAALVLAAAGPHLTFPTLVKDGYVWICIDTSGSMRSTDVSPTRAEASKAAARAFISETPPGTKLGVIAFSGNASIVQPLSADHQQVSDSLEDIPLPNGATAIGDALNLAAQNLPDRGHRVVILITDGVNNTGTDPDQAAQLLAANHIPIYTIGIGTPAGGLIPGTNEEATIDEQALRGYADVSGGAYARAENATQLHDALAQLGRVTAWESKPVDASLGFAFGGALCMLVAFLAGLGVGRYP